MQLQGLMTECVYSCEEEACEHCAHRNLRCVKVLGPKTRLAARTVVPIATHEQQVTRHSESEYQRSTTKVSRPLSQDIFQRRPYPLLAHNGLKDDYTGIIYQHLNVNCETITEIFNMNCEPIDIENLSRSSVCLRQNLGGPYPFGIPSKSISQVDKDIFATITRREIPRFRFLGLFDNNHDRHFKAVQFTHNLDTFIENRSKSGTDKDCRPSCT